MDQKEITQRALTLPEQAKKIRIETEEQYEAARQFNKRIAETQKYIDEIFNPLSNSAWKTYKEIKAQKSKLDKGVKEAREIVDAAIIQYKTKDDAERLALEGKLRKEAEEKKLQEAMEAEQRGDKEEASRIMEEPIVPVVIPTPVLKDGVSIRKIWKFRVVNIDNVPRIYMILDEVKVGAIVRALKGETRIDGIEVYSEDIVSVRTDVTGPGHR